MATTIKTEIGSWDTFHSNGPFETKNLLQTSLEEESKLPLALDRYNDAAREIQKLITDALKSHEGFRAFGSGWSMSHIAHQKDNMHFNAKMNLKIAINNEELYADSDFKSENLFFFECGNVIKEIHKFVSNHGKSLKTSGASNGQTIAGCLSTGVHGSAMDVGAVQDCVVGISLIIGDEPDDLVYLERHSQPALSDKFIDKIKSRVLRNDELFNAALVGLGAFGFIHGVVIETEDRFLLNRYVKKIDKNLALELADTLDFENSVFKIDDELDERGNGKRPYHYKIFINPYTNESEYVVEVMYKKPYQSTYRDPIPRIKTAIYRDLILLFVKIAEKHQNSIPKLIKFLHKSILPPVDLEITGTLEEIFWDAGYQGPAFACAVGINHTDSSKALEVLVKLAKEEGPVPGIYAMRFVKQSKATLAFTKFPITCMLEIDGLIWEAKKLGMISLENFCTRIIEVLKENNIAFTLHWGKNADWKFPELIPLIYGEKAKEWKKYRNSFLKEKNAILFSNDFLRQTNLDESPNDLEPEIIQSIAV